MTESSELAQLLDVSVTVVATVPGPMLTVSELLALGVGSFITTGRVAGESVEVAVGDASIGTGELGSANGRTVVRMVEFKGRT